MPYGTNLEFDKIVKKVNNVGASPSSDRGMNKMRRTQGVRLLFEPAKEPGSESSHSMELSSQGKNSSLDFKNYHD